MRYRDHPTVEVAERISCDAATAWALVTDIGLPARCSNELQSVEWLDGADRVAVGARFRGRNRHDAMGEWETVCEVVEVEDGRRWVWNVRGPMGISGTWGFEVEPAREGVIVRQWARMGPDRSGLSLAIDAKPDLEGRIIARRLAEWSENMRANLVCVRELAETSSAAP
ncbi:SRPBCC family protein [Nocardia sp. NPDC050406]|uniref:SRPBCC family protein n=1 Tax=Nocardia sp. NPDC050406 TaxID=3364318 RepID=UPI0037A0A7BC